MNGDWNMEHTLPGFIEVEHASICLINKTIGLGMGLAKEGLYLSGGVS